ncbi:MAG: ABC transporter ATP-binding protein [Clostridia bacterium]|nr:ABC transporter ATP-binding protein [Clostridia bacterium]
MLKLLKIEKAFGDKKVLDGFSLTLKKGDIAMLYGMSGCGKTTLLRIAAGLEKEDRGTVGRNGKIAVVFAEARLFPTATVLENITLVMSGDKRKNGEKAREILAAFGLSEAEKLYPHELSTGMAARVSLARAVAYDANIYLMDEPFKSLDGEVKTVVIEYLKAFLKEKATLIITHDEVETDAIGGKVCRMVEGKLI